MGKYLDIARKFEAQKSVPDYRTCYQQAADTVQEECVAIDSVRLLDCHPALWDELRDLDERLSALERSGAEEAAYKVLLEQLMACVRTAKTLYEQERSTPAVQ